jgi:membrane protein DedA with SNARE-associated domain
MIVDHIETLFREYGYLVLFAGLFLELIALPFPGEITMTYGGYLTYTHSLLFVPALLLSFLGTSCGITISYAIGHKIGNPLLEKFGKWIYLTPRRLDKTKQWFEKYGNKLLVISYFIPGVRHIVGYFAGTVKAPFGSFLLYAYSGAFFWCLTFLGLGWIFGPKWEQVLHYAEKNIWILLAAVAVAAVAFMLVRQRKVEM